MKKCRLKSISAKKLAALGRVPHSTLAPATEPMKRTAKLKVKGKARFPKGVDEAYRAWIREQPCCVPLCVETVIRRAVGTWHGSEAAHVRSRGAGGADDGNLLPLCHTHHCEQHRIGIKSFAAKHGVDLRALAADYWHRCERDVLHVGTL